MIQAYNSFHGLLLAPREVRAVGWARSLLTRRRRLGQSFKHGPRQAIRVPITCVHTSTLVSSKISYSSRIVVHEPRRPGPLPHSPLSGELGGRAPRTNVGPD